MTPTLIPLDLDAIQSRATAQPRVAGYPVVDGALPPPAILEQARAALQAGLPSLWFAPFAFVCEGRVVGSGGFKGPPRGGVVELGYGVASREQRRGVATAAVLDLCRMAFDQAEVAAVTAETAVPNIASQRVLEKAGFTRVGTRDTTDEGMVIQWRLQRRDVRGS